MAVSDSRCLRRSSPAVARAADGERGGAAGGKHGCLFATRATFDEVSWLISYEAFCQRVETLSLFRSICGQLSSGPPTLLLQREGGPLAYYLRPAPG